MIVKQTQDPTTEAQIWVEDYVSADASNITREFVNTVGFSYSNDVLTLGDPFVVQIPNPRGKYNKRFNPGSRVRFFLSNPNVAGGTLTLKHTGIITNRRISSAKGAGTVLQVECADLGWHLQNNDAPLWYNLRKGNLEGFLSDPKVIDRSWRIPGVKRSNYEARNTRLNNGLRAVTVTLNGQAIQPLYYIQVEPGDKIADLAFQYARRLNVLINIGPDGSIVLWNPDYTEKPLYRLDYHEYDDPDSVRNNVESVNVRCSIQEQYTDVTCVGERVQFEQDDPNNPNAAKYRGVFRPTTAPLPFRHSKIFSDGEMYTMSLAQKHAEWTWKRGMFDGWEAVYTVKGHYQGSLWYESDVMIEIHDSICGHDGLFYVSAVHLIRDEQGDRTEITVKLPNLLTAAFGKYPTAPTLEYKTKSEADGGTGNTRTEQTTPNAS